VKRPSSGGSEKSFHAPGLWESLRELLFGLRRRLDCVQVEVSSRCPGRCIYCPHTVKGAQWISRDMDMETFAAIWPLMRHSARVHLQGWGEPLLNPTFFEMVSLARRAGCAVSTTTCGLIMNDAVARKIVDCGMDIVAFSLTGTDAASSTARRGVAFDRVCEAVATLQSVRRARMGVHLEIHFAYLMLASGMEAVRGLPALMQRLGVHAAVVSTLDHIPEPSMRSEAFLPHESRKLTHAAMLLSQTESETKRLGLDFHWSLPRSDSPGTRCRENITRSLFVAADGSVSPCVYLNLPIRQPVNQHRAFGNVRQEDPLSIWESEGFRRFRDRLVKGDPDPACIGCVKRFEP